MEIRVTLKILETEETPKIFQCDLKFFSVITIVRLPKNEQLLDWPFTRLLLETLCIKTSNHLQVKGTVL